MFEAEAMVFGCDDLLGRPSPMGIAHLQWSSNDTLERGYYTPFLSSPQPDECEHCRTMY